MLWNSRSRRAGTPLRVGKTISLAVGLIVIGAIFLAGALVGAATDKHLSVYSVAANYSLPVVQRDGRDYVGLLELLEPLGKVSARSDNRGWRLRYNNVEGDFQTGKTHARVQGRDADLGGKFIEENNRGLVRVTSLTFWVARPHCTKNPAVFSSAAWPRTSPRLSPEIILRDWFSISPRR